MNSSERVKYEKRQLKSEYSVRTFAIVNNIPKNDLQCFLDSAFETLKDKIPKILKEFENVKVETHFDINFVKQNNAQLRKTECFAIDTSDIHQDLTVWYNTKIKHKILTQLEQNNVLGWKLCSINELLIDIVEITIKYLEKKTAFKNRIQTFSIVNIKHKDPKYFLDDAAQMFEEKVLDILQVQRRIKIHTCFEANYSRNDIDNVVKYTPHYIHTKSKIVDIDTRLKEWYELNIKSTILKQIEVFEQNGSGWTLDSIKELEIGCNKCNEFRGSSFIQLPEEIQKKKAIVNVKNKDDLCFKWALLSALHPAEKNAQRVSKYKTYENELNFNGIDFPVKIKDITKFEENNHNISVNVYAVDISNFDSNIVPIRITKNVQNKHVHLLLLTENCSHKNSKYSDLQTNLTNLEVNSHYCWIKDLSRLIRSSVTRHEHKCYVCDRCLQFYHNKEELTKHDKDCKQLNSCKVTMPTTENKWVSFKNYKNQIKVPFIIYADIESLLKRPSKSCEQEMLGVYQQHIPYSLGYYLKCTYDDTKSYYKSKRGLKCIEWFANELYEIAFDVAPILNTIVPINALSDAETKEFNSAIYCHICQKKFMEHESKIKDHSHLTGKYRGASHESCNLQFIETKTIPVVFHNLGYDSHFLIEKIATLFEGKVEVIPINNEKYISFTKTVDSTKIAGIYDLVEENKNFKENIKFRFIDSYRFLNSSLAELASTLEYDDLEIIKSEWSNQPNKISLLTRKGVFPYDFVDSYKKLNVQRLPTKDEFYSKLYETHITEDDYKHAKKVWKEFNITTLGEYSDLYLKTDVLLLADIFEKFRKNCMQIYSLDPAHYHTLPGLSWDAMLKITKVNIELITDIDMLLFIERGKYKVYSNHF